MRGEKRVPMEVCPKGRIVPREFKPMNSLEFFRKQKSSGRGISLVWEKKKGKVPHKKRGY